MADAPRPLAPIDELAIDVKFMILDYLDLWTISLLLQASRTWWSLRGEERIKERLASSVLLQNLPKPSTAIRAISFDGKPPEAILSCGDGRCLVFQRTDKLVMSVALWPLAPDRQPIRDVPYLTNPTVFAQGRLCLGYEGNEETYVIRQISDWSVIAKRERCCSFQCFKRALSFSSDLVILHCRRIQIWSPLLQKVWTLNDNDLAGFDSLEIVGENSIIATVPSRWDFRDSEYTVKVIIMEDISWKDQDKPLIKERMVAVTLPYDRPTEEFRYRKMRARRTRIINASLRGFSVSSYKFTKDVSLEALRKDEGELIGYHSDGSSSRHQCAHLGSLSTIKTSKGQETLHVFEAKAKICAASVFRDHIVTVETADRKSSKALWLRIRPRSGGVLYEKDLTKFVDIGEGVEIHIIGHILVVYSKGTRVLSFYMTWVFGDKTCAVRKRSRARSPYNLRKRLRRE